MSAGNHGGRRAATAAAKYEFDFANCLDRRFKRAGDGYRWASTIGEFEVAIAAARNEVGEVYGVEVSVFDLLAAGREVEWWRHMVRVTRGGWRERLQKQVGKALIRAPHRPLCAPCGDDKAGRRAPLVIRRSERTRRQFFGCVNFNTRPSCRYTLDVELAFDGPHQPVCATDNESLSRDNEILARGSETCTRAQQKTAALVRA